MTSLVPTQLNLKHWLMAAVIIVFGHVALSPVARAQAGAQDTSGKEFIMSCTYGLMAGTLVGAATLAFTDRPGENLNNVARGASFGLYSGILLGLYVVYVVPGQEENRLKQLDRLNDPAIPYEDSQFKSMRTPTHSLAFSGWGIAPRFDDGNELNGAQAQLLLSF